MNIQQSFIQIEVDLTNFCWKTLKHIYPWNPLEGNMNKVNETSMFYLTLDTQHMSSKHLNFELLL